MATKPEPRPSDAEEAEAARKATRRALRRLDVLEYVILFAAAVLSLLGGAVVAWILGVSAGLPFRPTWIGASLLLFIVPGGTVYLRELRRERKKSAPGPKSEPKDPHG